MLSSNKYKTLMVSINFSKDNLAGLGQAMFYQVQYKVSNNIVLYLTGARIAMVLVLVTWLVVSSL